MKDYYQILDLDKSAKLDEIKKSYRLYASKFHPDKHNGDKFFEERFKEILEAYEILSDTNKRKVYDKTLNKTINEDQNFSEKQPSQEYSKQTSNSQTTEDFNYDNENLKEGTLNENNNAIKNFGRFIFFGGIIISFLFLFSGHNSTMLFIYSINIAFWGGGLIWLIGVNLKN